MVYVLCAQNYNCRTLKMGKTLLPLLLSKYDHDNEIDGTERTNNNLIGTFTFYIEAFRHRQMT